MIRRNLKSQLNIRLALTLISSALTSQNNSKILQTYLTLLMSILKAAWATRWVKLSASVECRLRNGKDLALLTFQKLKLREFIWRLKQVRLQIKMHQKPILKASLLLQVRVIMFCQLLRAQITTLHTSRIKYLLWVIKEWLCLHSLLQSSRTHAH